MRLEAAMRAAGFTDKEANGLSVQRRVRQRPDYMTVKERKASLQISLPQSIKMKNSEGPPPLSPLSVSTGATARSNITLTILCLTSSQKQKTRVVDKRNREHEVVAHKKAKLMLQMEQKKDNGASPKKGSEAITTIVNEIFGTCSIIFLLLPLQH